MRIIRGILKGRSFKAPSNLDVRPTTNFAKEGIFNVLDNNFHFEDLKILDLCAGIGNMSLEFYSRGVGKINCVDINPQCCKFIQKVVDELKIDNLITHKSDAINYLKGSKQKFDIIFSDPPFENDFCEQIPDLVFEKDLLTDIGWLIIEHSKDKNFTEHPHFLKLKKYGKVHFSIFSKD